MNKYGKVTYYAIAKKDYTDGYFKAKKGQRVRVDGLDRDGVPYINGGHGLDIDLPLEAFKLVTVQGHLPEELSKNIGKVKRILKWIVKKRGCYYDDVFTKQDAFIFAKQIEYIMDNFKKVKAPKREDG